MAVTAIVDSIKLVCLFLNTYMDWFQHTCLVTLAMHTVYTLIMLEVGIYSAHRLQKHIKDLLG